MTVAVLRCLPPTAATHSAPAGWLLSAAATPAAGVLLEESRSYEVMAAEDSSPGLRRLLLHKTMLRDHYLDAYQAALRKAIAALLGTAPTGQGAAQATGVAAQEELQPAAACCG